MGVQQSVENGSGSRGLITGRASSLLGDLGNNNTTNDAKSVFKRWQLLRHDGKTPLFFTRTAIQAAMTVEPSESTKTYLIYPFIECVSVATIMLLLLSSIYLSLL